MDLGAVKYVTYRLTLVAGPLAKFRHVPTYIGNDCVRVDDELSLRM